MVVSKQPSLSDVYTFGPQCFFRLNLFGETHKRRRIGKRFGVRITVGKHTGNASLAPVKPINGARSKEDDLRLAQRKVAEARLKSGKKRITLLQQALAICNECAEAYVMLAAELNDYGQRIPLLRTAIEHAETQLGPGWKKKYQGAFWGATETRTLMRAMAGLANSLQWQNDFDEALEIYTRLLKMDPQDSLGIRYELAGCLYEAEHDDELEELLEKYADDRDASFTYTGALHLFRKGGPTKRARKALLDAFASNPHVPLFLSDLLEVPSESSDTYVIGEESEAIAYVSKCNYLWYDTEGAVKWMSEELAAPLKAKFVDRSDLVDEVIAELRALSS